MNRVIKYRIRLKCIKSHKGWNAGDTITMCNEIFKKPSGLAWLQLNDGWEIESIDRFTGHTDNNGREIYESDIIKSHDEDINYCLCEWNEKNACFEINGYGYSMYHGENSQEEYNDRISRIEDHYLVLGGDNEIEVIGNIYENPELLNA